MSNDILEQVSEVQDQVIQAIAGVKEPLADAVNTVVSFVVDRVDVPAVPYADSLPTPKEVIDLNAKFATKVVSTNKSVALAAAKAASPLTDQLLDRPAPKAKTASRAAA